MAIFKYKINTKHDHGLGEILLKSAFCGYKFMFMHILNTYTILILGKT